MKSAVALRLALAIGAAGALPATAQEPATAELTSEAQAEAEQRDERRRRILEQLDFERAAEGLGPLVSSPALDRAAQARAETLATLRQPPDLLEQLAAEGYQAEVAELVKLTGGGTPERKVSDLVEANAAFREVVLTEELTEIGIGVTRQAGRPLDLLLFARSRAAAFAEQTGSLGDREASRAELLEWSNWARAEYGRARPLTHDPCLERVAQAYAEKMLEEGFFGHLSPLGETVVQRVRAAGCPGRGFGENLASGPTAPVDTVAGWLESASHRRTLLSREYQRVGFGIAFGEGATGFHVLWVQVVAGG